MQIIGARQETFRPLDAVLDHDPLTGVTQRMVIDSTGQMRLETSQEDDAIRHVAHEESMSHSRSERIGEWRKVATVPVLVMYDLIRRGIWRDPERKRAWLNSDEARPYRTHWARL